MAIGVSEEHEELRRSVRRWTDRHLPSAVARQGLDEEVDALPKVWADLVDQGWLGIHVGEWAGGEGAGIYELAVVLEELARAAAPGPFLPTALAAAILERGAQRPSAEALLPGLIDGSTPAAVAFGPGASPARAERRPDGGLVVCGTFPAVLGAGLASLVLVPLDLRDGGSDEAPVYAAVDLRDERGDVLSGVRVVARPCLDHTRRSAALEFVDVPVGDDRLCGALAPGAVDDLAVVMAAAELTGSARWCLETAAEHARTRVQFGRPIGQFQAVKHKLANLLAVVEQMTAASWDAALAADDDDPAQRRLAAAVAGAVCVEGAIGAARDAIQVLGGMGFTWEHDAHLHLRRSTTMRQLLGPPSAHRASVATQALGGARRTLGVDLPHGTAESLRAELGPVVASVAAADPADHRRLLGESGLLFPHWPAPFGRDAGPVEQLVVDELLAEAGIRRPPANVAAWALPTLIAHGTPAQRDRFILPTLRGEVLWCQLFSEPGAGSDLAALSTRAERVEGGWALTGQKVWTSVAARADWGICLARTDPDAAKHAGITYFLVDMKSEGIEVRPLRELTGDALFNEVFLDGCFVPDECVVGEVNGGWRLARTTLANERVSLAAASTFGGPLEAILATDGRGPFDLDALGRLLVDAQTLSLMGQRTTLRSLAGVEPGPESSIRKLLAAEHDQRVSDFGLERCGAAGAFTDADSAHWAHAALQTLCLTIAGGTSEVQRNVIGERLLGLPRDPEPKGAH